MRRIVDWGTAFVGRWRKVLVPLLVLSLFALALTALRGELASYDFRHIRRSSRDIPTVRLVQAILFTICSSLVLILQESLALRYVRRTLAGARVAFVGFVSYALSNALGFPLILGSGVRYRLYNAWGLSSAEIALTVAFNGVTFWLGIFTVAGLAFVLEPASPDVLNIPLASLRPLGIALLLVVAAYLTASVLRRETIRWRGWEFSLPAPSLAFGQVLFATVDWMCAAAVLWSLIPVNTPALTFPVFLSVFILAQVAGLLSHVPAGMGVFETIFIFLLKADVAPSVLLSALLVYRVVYYLLPLAVAVIALATNEISRGHTRIARGVRATSVWAPGVAPTLLSVTTFFGGAILLFSGATPALGSRLRALSQFVPLGVIESSHFIASLMGAALLVLSRGLGRRLDAAYYLTMGALGIGILTSLLKGFDYEEAIALSIILAALVPARRHFYRRASLIGEVFRPSWVLMTTVVVAATIWLGMFAYKHVDYSNDLWWRFAVRGDAPRFLRATVGVVVILLLVALRRLLRPMRPVTPTADAATLVRVRQIVVESRDSTSNLALLGDKSLLFSEQGNAFVMYGVEGRSFVAMGDPVGAPRERKELAWQFRELADRHGARTVFYQVRMHHLPLYLDLGLSLLKLGEEARVSLSSFSLDGGTRKGLRRVVKQVEKEGCGFMIASAAEVPALLPRLKVVSDNWLAAKKTREKGFSLGFFDERYLGMNPVALVTQGTEIVAFANLWTSAEREELSVDLMRYVGGAPDGVMEYLFIQLMLWGRETGYSHFNLGMAPLSGFENRQLAPIWNRVGALLYKHAENVYNFQGLRAYKDKFDPVWEPRYLASPGGLALPRILTNVATLVGRGLRGVITK